MILEFLFLKDPSWSVMWMRELVSSAVSGISGSWRFGRKITFVTGPDPGKKMVQTPMLMAKHKGTESSSCTIYAS